MIEMLNCDCMEYMAGMPDKAFDLAIVDKTHTMLYGMRMRTSKELQIGKAGEYLVCADLILKGFVAFPSEQGLPYDVLLDTGEKIVKIQVKTTRGPRIIPQRATESKAYIFNVKKCGKGNVKRYVQNEIDIFALVCLDTKMIGYIKTDDMPDTINYRVDSLQGSYYDEKGIRDYEIVSSLYINGSNRREISEKTGLAYATVSRMLQEGYRPFKTDARYFSETQRNAEWFRQI